MSQSAVRYDLGALPTDLRVTNIMEPLKIAEDVPQEQVTADSSSSPNNNNKIFSNKDHDKMLTTRETCDSTEELVNSVSFAGLGAAVSTEPSGTLIGGVNHDGSHESNIRRYRTAFRPEQIKRLENEFIRDNYISRPKRNELAKELGLSEGTIKVWFQNRRMKHKRQQLTNWPLDPRFADPILAALLLQAAAVNSAAVRDVSSSPVHALHMEQRASLPASGLAAAKMRLVQSCLPSGALLPPPPPPPAPISMFGVPPELLISAPPLHSLLQTPLSSSAASPAACPPSVTKCDQRDRNQPEQRDNSNEQRPQHQLFRPYQCN